MKTILLFAHDDAGQEARLQAALDVTRAMDGHLSCVDVIMSPTSLAHDAYSGYVAAGLIEEEQRQEAANRSRIEERLAREDVAWSWTEVHREPASTIEAEARLADVIVLSGELDDVWPAFGAMASDIVRKADCPILIVDRGTRGIQLNGTAIVAWDGSREAGEALRDAVPLLKLADEVILTSVGDSNGALAAEPAAQYLSRHGVHARIDALDRVHGESVGDTILEHARRSKADYIVMGAYGHSPAREAIFGGVTRSMLAHSELPLLLAH